MVVPGVLVHGVEGHATGLHGSCSGGGGRMMFLGLFSRPVSNSSFPRGQFGSGLVGFVEGKSFWNFDGRSSVQ